MKRLKRRSTCRCADTDEENVAVSAAAAATSACLKSVTPRGDRASGPPAHPVVGAPLVRQRRGLPGLEVLSSAMSMTRRPSYVGLRVRWLAAACAMQLVCSPARASAQEADHPVPHQHAADGPLQSLFPAREASGTAWLPDVSTAHGVHLRNGSWELMLHGAAFAQYLYEPGGRHRTGGFADSQVSSVNWGMLMARRPVGRGRLGVRAALSFEPWTVSDCGFLNYLATGETCDGDTIHDRQHPHDLVMELAADYDRPLGGSLRWQVYAGLSGEPALGPPAFPHRPSAMPNPVAPIAHHWLDSSHIAFGLVTVGVYGERWKAEVSSFNGREPDEDRADLDLAALDSLSGRVTFAPTGRLVLQVSGARLREAEAELPPLPRSDVNRATASATYHHASASGGFWATTLAYGVNAGSEVLPDDVVDLVTHGVLLESALTLRERHSWFGRIEIVGKPAHDLHAHEFGSRVFPVGKLEAGYVRFFDPWNRLVAGVGAMGTVNVLPAALAPRYSGRLAPGVAMFLTIRPASHAAGTR